MNISYHIISHHKVHIKILSHFITFPNIADIWNELSLVVSLSGKYRCCDVKTVCTKKILQKQLWNNMHLPLTLSLLSALALAYSLTFLRHNSSNRYKYAGAKWQCKDSIIHKIIASYERKAMDLNIMQE